MSLGKIFKCVFFCLSQNYNNNNNNNINSYNNICERHGLNTGLISALNAKVQLK